MGPVFAPTGEDPESKSVIKDSRVMVAVDPFNPSLHIKKTKGEVLKEYDNVFEVRFTSWLWDVGGTYHGIEDIESAVGCASRKI